tara:strand:+ start:468 stop:1097 length:630 start_codon:yes stop_codon:yes gene_type:complete
MTFGLVKHNNNSISAITSGGQLAQGKMTFIKEQTASSSASISFVDGSSSVVLDSTYPIYLFKLINIHPSNDDINFNLNFSIDSGSNYNVTKTTTFFKADHDEGDSSTNLSYLTAGDKAQSTAEQSIGFNLGNGNDECISGEMFLFAPSDTTFIKHFMVKTNVYDNSNVTRNIFVAGYCNTTSAVNGVRFQPFSGNIDTGTIKLYGIKGS